MIPWYRTSNKNRPRYLEYGNPDIIDILFSHQGFDVSTGKYNLKDKKFYADDTKDNRPYKITTPRFWAYLNLPEQCS